MAAAVLYSIALHHARKTFSNLFCHQFGNSEI